MSVLIITLVCRMIIQQKDIKVMINIGDIVRVVSEHNSISDHPINCSVYSKRGQASVWKVIAVESGHSVTIVEVQKKYPLRWIIPEGFLEVLFEANEHTKPNSSGSEESSMGDTSVSKSIGQCNC